MQMNAKAQAVNKAQRQLQPEPYFLYRGLRRKLGFNAMIRFMFNQLLLK